MSRKIAIGVDLGGTNVRVAIGDSGGRILTRISEKTERNKGPMGISNQIVRMINFLKSRISGTYEILGIGVGSTGPVILEKGGLKNPTNIPYSFIPLVKPIKESFDLNVYLLNDGSAAVIGEKIFGLGRGYKNLAYITLSTGIGGGVFVDNHLLLGKDGNAAEMGHFTVDYNQQLLCSCGKKGHWEAYCSGKGIPNYFKYLLDEKNNKELSVKNKNNQTNFDVNNLSARKIFETAKEGNPFFIQVVEKIGVLNSIGVACVVDAYDPSLITIGGTVALKNSDLIINPIRKNIVNHARNRLPKIFITPLGKDIVLLGALALVFNIDKNFL